MNAMQKVHPADVMVTTLSKLLHNDETVFHGVSSHLPMVAILLAKARHAKDLVYLNIPGGVNPKSLKLSPYSSASLSQYSPADAVFPLEEVFDLSMRGGLDVAFLSGVQFDVQGNVNASVIGPYHQPKVRLPGGAGSAVLIPTAKRALIWRTKHDVRTFVKQVDFVTTKGNIDRIVTPLCVFKFEDYGLKLEAISPLSSFEEVQEHTGFDLEKKVYEMLPYPTPEELRMLHRIDPMGLRYKEF